MSLLERPSLFSKSVRSSTQRATSAKVATEKLTDAELLTIFIEREDRNSLEILYHRHTAMILSVCANLLSESHDIEDACQSVLLKLMRKAGSIRNRESLAPWLHRVARAEAMQIHRNRKRRKTTELADVSTDSETESNTLLSVQEQMELLHDELNQLPEKYRGPIILCFLQGKSRLEAAEALGATDASVKASLMRGRELLRKRLLKRGIALTTVLAIWEGGQASAAIWGQNLAGNALSACATPSAGSAILSVGSAKLSTIFSKLASRQLGLSCAVMFGLSGLAGWFWLNQSGDGRQSVAQGSTITVSAEEAAEAIRLLNEYEATLQELQTLQFHIERQTWERGGAFGFETWRYKHKGDFFARDGYWRYRYKYIGNGYHGRLYPVFGASEQILNKEGYAQFSQAFTTPDEPMTPDSQPQGELWRVCSGITRDDGSPSAQTRINEHRNSNLEVLGFLPYDASRQLPELMKAYQPRLSGHEVVDGHATVVVTSDGYYGTHTVWLDPEAGYLPRRIQCVKERDDLFNGWPLNMIRPHNDAEDRRPNLQYQRMTVTVDEIEIEAIGDTFVMNDFDVTLNRVYTDNSEFNTRFEYALSDFSQEVTEEDLNMTIEIPEGTKVFVTNNPHTEFVWQDGKPVEASQSLEPSRSWQDFDETNTLTD